MLSLRKKPPKALPFRFPHLTAGDDHKASLAVAVSTTATASEALWSVVQVLELLVVFLPFKSLFHCFQGVQGEVRRSCSGFITAQRPRAFSSLSPAEWYKSTARTALISSPGGQRNAHLSFLRALDDAPRHNNQSRPIPSCKSSDSPLVVVVVVVGGCGLMRESLLGTCLRSRQRGCHVTTPTPFEVVFFSCASQSN